MLVSDTPRDPASLTDHVPVLILVLVDVGLGPEEDVLLRTIPCRCLNPCFSGCWSRTALKQDVAAIEQRLNPCFSGCWSRTGVVVYAAAMISNLS